MPLEVGMRIKLLFAFFIFLGSYLPLSIILFIQDFRFEYLQYSFCNILNKNLKCELPLSNPQYSITAFLLCLICFLLLVISLKLVRPRRPILIIESKHIPSELMNYTLPYVVSFMNIEFDKPSNFYGFIVFLFWMFLISNSSGIIMLNPILSIFGWKLYEIKYKYTDGVDVFTSQLLSRTTIEPMVEVKSAQVQEIIIV